MKKIIISILMGILATMAVVGVIKAYEAYEGTPVQPETIYEGTQRPITDNTYDLGTPIYKWDKIYANFLSASSTSGFSNWQFTSPNAITPTSTVGIIVSASSTFLGDLTVGPTSMFIDVDGDIDFDSNTLYVETAGNMVGVGTNNPLTTLHIHDSTDSTDVDLRIEDTSEAMIQFSDGADDAAYIRMPADGDLIISKGPTGVDLVIDDGSNVGIGTTGPDYPLSILSTTGPQVELVHTDSAFNAIFQVDADGDLSATSTSGNFLFGENDTAFIGIGIANPDGTLHARGNGVANTNSVIADVKAGAIGRSGSLILRSSLDSANGTFNSWRFTHYGQATWQSANNYLGFDTATNSTNWATKMVILDSGNVGIATTTPPSLLTVNGDVLITGDLDFQTAGSGMLGGGISVTGTTTASVISGVGVANKVQVGFDVSDWSNDATVSVSTDDITINTSGLYFVAVSGSVDSVGGGSVDFGWNVYTNNGSVTSTNVHTHRTLSGGGGEAGSISLSGGVFYNAGDTVELWVWNEDSTTNIINSDMTMTLFMLGGPN